MTLVLDIILLIHQITYVNIYRIWNNICTQAERGRRQKWIVVENLERKQLRDEREVEGPAIRYLEGIGGWKNNSGGHWGSILPPPLTPHPTTQWKQIAPTSVVLLEEKRLNRTKDWWEMKTSRSTEVNLNEWESRSSTAALQVCVCVVK